MRVTRAYSRDLFIFLPFVLIYFFVNNVGLPMGLQYTTILAPLFYMWLHLNKERWILSKFIIISLPFIIIHFYVGFDAFFYFRSYILLFLVYIVIYASFQMMHKLDSPHLLMRRIIKINFVVSCLALLTLGTSISDIVWVNDAITMGSGAVNRLRLFTYEPSYYATLMVPFFVYSLSTFFAKRSVSSAIYLLASVLPMMLAFSLGVIGSLVVAVVVVFLWNWRISIMQNPLIIFLIPIILAVGYVSLSSDNQLSLRVNNVVNGEDSSGNVRTIDAFNLAYYVADSTSLWWGAGFGQSKLILSNLVSINHFDEERMFRITNTVASTFSTLGIMGLALRFGVEFFLFFKTRVYTSKFRLTLFTFIFIYQFTGSYMTSVAEYIIWLFAFVPFFMNFEYQSNLSGELNGEERNVKFKLKVRDI